MGRIVLVFVLAALMSLARAGPIQQKISVDTCATSCTESNKFNYLPGNTYEYQYDADVKTNIQGASEDEARIHLGATVKMEVLSKCELVMRLSDVTVTEYDPIDLVMKKVGSEFKDGLERLPVRLSFQDGNIAELCLKSEEPAWVLNAKRGIISMFQNNMDDFTANKTVSETDVSGQCDTDYHMTQNGWVTTTISKTKNLLGCKDRTGFNSAIQGVPYTVESEIQSLPIVKSDHNCVHEIDKASHYLKSATCTEKHMFKPFSRSDSGAVTSSAQSLKFIQIISGVKSPVAANKRVSLKFDHVIDPNREQKTRKDITRQLIEICEKTKAGVRPETPQLFSKLVAMVKTVDTETLMAVYKLVQEGTLCKDNNQRTSKYFLDSIPMAGTPASLHLMTELMTKQLVTGVEADMWLTSLAFIKTPTQEMLREVKPLINMKQNSNKALLSVGTLIHNYCSNRDNCDRDNMVRALISVMQNKMTKNCKVTTDNFETTLMVLRGLGNAGYAQSAIPTLEVCMRVTSNPIEIRLSAIEAFRRMPCTAEKRAIEKIFLDSEEDSEIRIAAYKVLMECPSPDIINTVRSTLASEEINQVGSYIWSHLTNLMETSDRHKQHIRAILEDETFKKEFDLDQRKFSRNYEGSMFVEKLNTGAKAEGDLIWSSKSFIPRSGMVNLTVELFGQSVNLLELGGRAEGIEYFLESFFGPNGYFNGEEAQESKDLALKTIRQDKIKRIDGRFTSKADELRGSMYMRVFGNELSYMNFQGLDSLLTGPNFNILDMMIQLAKDNDYTYSQSSQFLDTSIIIPTGSGLPLNLTVTGVASVDLRMKGKMDLRSPPSVDIQGLVQPSAAIDITSQMSVDAFVTKSGVKMVSTLHSSTSVQGKVKIAPSGEITAEYEMPQPKMDVIDVKSSFFTIHRDMEKEQKMIADNVQKKSACSPTQVVTVTGLELCAEVTYPNASLKIDAPYFPLTGPVSAGIYLYNRDTHTKYMMSAKSTHTKASNILHFTFDTPNSRINRRVVLNLNLNKQATTVDMTLNSPWKNANLQGAVTKSKDVMGLNGKMSIDGKSGYSFDSKMLTKRQGKSGWRFTPTLDINAPQIKPISLRAMMMYDSLKQLDLEYDMSGLTANPVTAKFSLFNKMKVKGLSASLQLMKDRTYSIVSNLNVQATNKKVLYKPMVSIRSPEAEVLSFGGTANLIFGKKINVALVLDKVVAKKITLKGFVAMSVRKRGRVLYSSKMNYLSGPMDLQAKIKLDNRNFRSMATDIDLTYVIRKFARNNIKLVSKINNLSSKNLSKGKAAVSFLVSKNPELNLKIISNINHNKKHSEIDADIRYGANFKNESQHITMEFEMNRIIKSLYLATADLSTRIRYPALDLNMVVKGDHVHNASNLDTNIFFKYGKNQPIQSSLRIDDLTGQDLLKIKSEYTLKYPGREVALNYGLEQTTPNTYVSSLDTQLQKGQKNSYVTKMITEQNRDRVTIISDMTFSKSSPIHIEGKIDLDPRDFVTGLSYERDSKKYAGMLSSVTNGASEMVLDLEHPERRVLVNMNGKKMSDRYQVEADLKWNAGRDDSDKIHVSSWFQPPTQKKVNGSISVALPSRTLILNVQQTAGNNYFTHADFQWEEEKKISTDLFLAMKQNTIVSSLKLATPFKAFPSLKVDLSHKDDSEEYVTDLDVTWDKKGFVNSELTLKKPLSIKTLVLVFTSKSSIKDLKNTRFTLDHKLSDSLDTTAKLNWNKQFVHADIAIQTIAKGAKQGFKGLLNTKTSFPYCKKGSLSFNHNNNGQVFNTNAALNRNKKKYEISSTITHIPTNTSYATTGSVDVTTPTGINNINWNHRHTAKDVKSTINSSWGKKGEQTAIAKLNGNFDKAFDTTFSLNTPFDQAQDVLVETAWKCDVGAHNSKLSILHNGKKIGSTGMNYKHNDKKNSVDADIHLVIPQLDIDSRIVGKAEKGYPDYHPIATLDIVITPNITMNLEAQNVIKNEEATVSTFVILKSSFPGYKYIKYTYDILSDGRNLDTTTRLQYSNNKVIELRTKVYYEKNVYKGSTVLTTPYEALPSIKGSLNFAGDLQTYNNFNGDSSIEILPVLEKTSAAVSWNIQDKISAEVRMDMPCNSFPYLQLNFDGEKPVVLTKNSGVLKIQYNPAQTVIVDASYNMENTADLNVKVTSPAGSMTVSHQGSLQSFTSKGLLETTPGKPFGLNIDFTNGDKIEARANVQLPTSRDVNVYVSHQGTALDFSTHAEVNHNRKNMMVSDLSFVAGQKIAMTASGSLRSEMISNDEYKVSFNTQIQPMRKLTAHGEVYTTSQGKSEADVNVELTNDVSASLTIKSPMFKNIKASFDHQKGDTYMTSKAQLTHGGIKKVDIFATLTHDDAIVGEVTINTPFAEDIRVRTRINNSPIDLVINSEGSLGSKKAEVDIRSTWDSKRLQETVSVKATGMDDIVAEVSVNGDLSLDTVDLRSHAELNIGQDRHRIDASINSLQELEGSLSISSPMVKPISTNFNVRWEPTYFKTHAEMNIDMEKSEIDASLQANQDIEGSLSVNSPYFTIVSAKMYHNNKMPLNSHAQLTLNDKDKFDVKVTLAIDDSIPVSGSITIETPFTNYTNMQTAFTHEGNMKNFRSHAEYSLGSDKSEVDVNYDSLRRLEGQMSVRSHLFPEMSVGFEHSGTYNTTFKSHGELSIGTDKYEVDLSKDEKLNLGIVLNDVKVEFEQTGELKDFATHLEITQGNAKTLADLAFSVNGGLVVSSASVSGLRHFYSPSENVCDMAANFKHSGSLNDFSTHVDFTKCDDKSESDASFKMETSSVISSFSIKSPYMDNVFVNFNHNGQLKDFTTKGSVTVGRKRSTGDVSVQISQNGLMSSLNLRSPYIDNILMQLKHDIERNGFTTVADLTVGKDKSQAKITHQMAEGIDSSAHVESPYMDNIAVNFKHNGDRNALNTQADLQVGQDKSEVQLRHNMDDKSIESSLDIKSPYIDDIELKFTHDGKLHGDITLGGVKSTADVALSTADGTKATVVISSPKLSLNLDHSYKSLNLLSTIDMTYDQDKYTSEVKLVADNTIECSVKVTSPVEGYETISALYTHSGKPTNFNCHAEVSLPGKTNVGDLKVNVENLSDMDAILELSMPTIPSIVYKISHKLTSETCKTNLEMSMNGETIYGVSADFANTTKYEGSIDIRTPIEKYELTSLNAEYHQDSSLLKSMAALNFGGNTNKVDLSITSSPAKYEGLFKLNTVYLPVVKANFELINTAYKKEGSTELSVDGNKEGSIDFSFDSSRGIVSNFNIEIPRLTNYTQINGKFSKTMKPDSKWERYDIQASLTNEGKTIIEAVSDTKVSSKITGDISLKSIYTSPLAISFGMNKGEDLTDLTTSIQVFYDGQELVKSTVAYKYSLEPLSGSVSASVNQYSGAYSLEAVPRAFKTHAETTLDGDKWSADASFSLAVKNDIDASFKIMMPSRSPIQGSFTHNPRYYKTLTHAELEIDAESKYVYDMILKHRRGIDGTFTVNTPIEGMKETVLRINHNGDFPNFVSTADIVYNKQTVSVSANLVHTHTTKGEVTLKTPFEGFEDIAVSFYNEGDLSKFETGGEVQYAPGKAVIVGVEHSLSGSTLKSQFHLMSPFTDEIVISANHSGTPVNFVSNYELSMGADNSIRSETTFKSGFEYLTFTTSLTTTMSGETFVQRAELKHDGNLKKFRTEAILQAMEKTIELDTSFQMNPIIEGSASLKTPFFQKMDEIKVTFSHIGSESGFLSTGEIQYAPKKKISGKIDVLNHGMKRMVTTVEIKTPYKGMEVNKITYQHTGNTNGFSCDADIIAVGKPISSSFKVSQSPLSVALDIKTPFEGYQTIALIANLNAPQDPSKSIYSTKINAMLNPRYAFTLDGSLNVLYGRVQGSGSITTPYQILKKASVEFDHQEISVRTIESVKALYNGESVLDAELEHILQGSFDPKKISLVVRAPRPMKYEIQATLAPAASKVDAVANWNTDNRDSNVEVEASYDVNTDKKINVKVTGPSRQVMSLNGFVDLKQKQSKSDLVWGIGVQDRAGYDVTINDNDAKLKLVLPTRSIEMSGSKRSKVTEGSILWDADVDPSKKVGFRSVVMPTKDSIKADITLQLPSLGKNVQVGSEMIVNRGRVIFDGKTEFSYSTDESKKIVFSSRLEDLSVGASNNYSFSLGLRHPYSTVGIKMASHVSKSNNRYSAGMGLEYLTAKRQTKTVQVNGEINKLKKTISLELYSPIKSISISGSAETKDKFRVSILNIYDSKSPLSTVFMINPSTRSIDFTTNYDLDNPRSEFHISAKYVNSSAVAAEVFHIVNRERVSDILVTARLNNSRLLHTRVHWRPEMITELQAQRARKMNDYKKRLELTAEEVATDILEEMVQKYNYIMEALGQEIGIENVETLESLAQAMVIPYPSMPGLQIVGNYISDIANSTQYRYSGLVKQYNDYKVPNMNDHIYMGMIREPVQRHFDNAIEMLEAPRKSIAPSVTQAIKYAAKRITESKNYDTKMLEGVLKMYEVEENLESVIQGAVDMLTEEAKNELIKVRVSLLNSAMSDITVYDPVHGEIQAEFHLPIPVMSLDVMPSYDMARVINKLRKYSPSQIKLPQIPDVNAGWMAPFAGQASITNGHKITTFDGFIYDLDIDCTFVLVRDYANGNFSVILNNNDVTTLTVLSHGKPIELKQSGEISVGMEPVTLPYSEKDFTISSPEQGIITINGADHFKIWYDLNVDHIVVKVNGWYYGKTGGLLGVYDNEPSNDLMTSFNKVVRSPARFAKTWDVGSTNCR